jgi:Ca-activated chloride channel family protein
MIESDLDENTLQEMAAQTGGQYFRAQNAEELKAIYEQIDTMEKTEIRSMSYTTYSERFFPWLLAGALLLLVEIVLSQTVLRRIP